MKNTNSNSTTKNYAIVIPCYNEEKRFPYDSLLKFAKLNPDVILCLVDDGSKDKTLSILRALEFESSENVCVYALSANSGKAEAVRKGMLHVYSNYSTELIGFLDADLATTPEEWLQMAQYKKDYAQFGMIVGSRLPRLGAKISRDNSRKIISAITKKVIRVILKTPTQDTQCGAKIFDRVLVPNLFNKPFLTPWLFDVEIYLRLQKRFGSSVLMSGVLEFPLMNWTEISGSKISWKDSIKMPMQLLKLHLKYNIADRFNPSSPLIVKARIMKKNKFSFVAIKFLSLFM